jgi:hypothetical protein
MRHLPADFKILPSIFENVVDLAGIFDILNRLASEQVTAG